jgi:hypothetical protein
MSWEDALSVPQEIRKLLSASVMFVGISGVHNAVLVAASMLIAPVVALPTPTILT